MRILGKIFKWLGLLVLLVIVLVAGLPQLPVLKDTLTAGKYKDWLNAELVPLDLSKPDADFTFPEEIGKARLIMLSEIHGYGAVQRLDLALLTYLNENHGVRAYLAEMSPAQAIAVNIYISGGTDERLRRVFDRWAEEAVQWGNREFFEKISAIRQLNETLPEDRKIWFVGVDQIYDRAFAEELSQEVTEDGRIANSSGFESEGQFWKLNADLLEASLSRDDETSRYRNILTNISQLMEVDGAKSESFYGLWGYFHGSKVPINGSKPLAMRLNEEGGAFEGSVTAIGTACIDGCFNMMPAWAAPPPFQPKGDEKYVLMPMNYDSAYLARLRGIGEVKSAMGESRVAMVPLSAEGSPYLDGQRLVNATGYITMMSPFVYDGSGGEALDYFIAIRGSAALTPWRGSAYDVTGGNAEKAGIN